MRNFRKEKGAEALALMGKACIKLLRGLSERLERQKHSTNNAVQRSGKNIYFILLQQIQAYSITPTQS